MNRKWKYFIVLNDNFPHNIVEYEETQEGELPLCCDLNVAINFNSLEELTVWVKEHTSLSLENCDYHVEVHYLSE